MDVLYHGFLMDGQLTFAAIDGRELVSVAQQTHRLSRVATAALGRQLMMTAILASSLKQENELVTTMLQGDGVSSNLVCTGRYGALVKGYATDGACELPPRDDGKLDVSGFVGHHGKLTVIRDLGLKEPYIGICHLVSGEIAEDFAQYFTLSEQKPSLCYLSVHERGADGAVIAACGILIQPLPGCPDSSIDAVMSLAPAISEIGNRLSNGETLKPVLADVFNEAQAAFLKEMRPAFCCDCSRERLYRVLASVGREDLQDMMNHDHGAELTCQFCEKTYRFSEQDLQLLLDSACERKP